MSISSWLHGDCCRVLAVLVTLATAGFTPAMVVFVVAVLVQQFDNDLLAPFIYGQSLDLHPAAILVALTAGGALGGIIGAFVAVPLTSAITGAGRELWNQRAALDPAPSREVLDDEGG